MLISHTEVGRVTALMSLAEIDAQWDVCGSRRLLPDVDGSDPGLIYEGRPWREAKMTRHRMQKSRSSPPLS